MKKMGRQQCFVCGETDKSKFKPLAGSIHAGKWICTNPNCLLIYINMKDKDIIEKRAVLKEFIYDRATCMQYLNLNDINKG